MATEPLWATGFAFLLLGENVDPGEAVGGLVLLAGCLGNTLLPPTLLMPAEASAE